MVSIGIGRYASELAHVISHGGIPDHSVAGHTHDHGHHDHTHDFIELDKAAFHSDVCPASNQQSSKLAVAIDVFYPGTNDKVIWSIINFLPYNESVYQEIFWHFLYTRSLIDPPELS